MRKSPLPAEDAAVADRLRLARSFVGASMAECSEALGVKPGTWLNYEAKRAPLPYDVGLRFCRQFIVSEEWLATGENASALEAAGFLGTPITDEVREAMNPIFTRLCMDLLSEPTFHEIPKGTTFFRAFADHLAPIYRAVFVARRFVPRVRFSDRPERALLLNSVREQCASFLQLLSVLTTGDMRLKWETERLFVFSLMEVAALLFGSFAQLDSYEEFQVPGWLRDIVRTSDQRRSSRAGGIQMAGLTNKSTDVHSMRKSDLAMIDDLIIRVRSETSQRGARAALARRLDVAPQQLNSWLTRSKKTKRRKPSGEMVLRLQAWLAERESERTTAAPGYPDSRTKPGGNAE